MAWPSPDLAITRPSPAVVLSPFINVAPGAEWSHFFPGDPEGIAAGAAILDARPRLGERCARRRPGETPSGDEDGP